MPFLPECVVPNAEKHRLKEEMVTMKCVCAKERQNKKAQEKRQSGGWGGSQTCHHLMFLGSEMGGKGLQQNGIGEDTGSHASHVQAGRI